MSNIVIFATQIATVLSFIIAVFFLYRLLVKTKDATIQLLQEKVTGLEKQLDDAKAAGPDVLAKNLSDRVQLYEQELERLSKDDKKNASAIKEKEGQLRNVKTELSYLEGQLEQAQVVMAEFFCPYCKSPMITREYRSQMVEYDGHEIDDDSEYVEFECGLSLEDSHELSPCPEKEGTVLESKI